MKTLAIIFYILGIYFIFSSIFSNKGYIKYRKIQKEYTNLSKEIERLKYTNFIIQSKINMLKEPINKEYLSVALSQYLGITDPKVKLIKQKGFYLIENSYKTKSDDISNLINYD